MGTKAVTLPTKAEIEAVSGPAWTKLSNDFAARRLGVVRKLLAFNYSMAAIADMMGISRQGLVKFTENRSKKDGG